MTFRFLEIKSISIGVVRFFEQTRFFRMQMILMSLNEGPFDESRVGLVTEHPLLFVGIAGIAVVVAATMYDGAVLLFDTAVNIVSSRKLTNGLLHHLKSH